MSKHTPGPWQVQDAYLNVFTCTNGTTGLTVHLAKVNAVQCAGGRAEALANARLIAAAPDLLEALVELSKSFVDTYFDDPRSDEEIDGHQEFWENKARAAIAKATGGTP
jgi:hypothetical protein